MNQLVEADLVKQAREKLRIHVGGLASGTRIPPERELSRQLGIGRTVLRPLLAELVDEGRLARRQGAGTFVLQPEAGTRATGLTEELSRRGVAVSVEYLAPPSDDDPDLPAPGWLGITRLRSAGSSPLSVETTWIPQPIAQRIGLLAVDGSLYGALERCGHSPATAAESLEAVQATPALAEHLGCRRGDPLLRVHRTAFEADGTVLEVTRTFFRGDRVRLVASGDPTGGLAAMLTISDTSQGEQ